MKGNQEECTIPTTPQKKYFDILGHKLVPEHAILTEKEKKELLEKYNIRSEHLPRILSTDPATISIGAKPGQVIKILRKSPTAKYTVAYRLVIESESTGEVTSFAEPSEEFTASEES